MENRLKSQNTESDARSDDIEVPAAWWLNRRTLGYGLYVASLSLAFSTTLVDLGLYVLKKDLHSYTLLIPFVSLYMASLKWASLPREAISSAVWDVGWAVIFGLAAAALNFGPDLASVSPLSQSASMSQTAACYVLLLIAGGCAFLGMTWMRLLMFPFAFLLFMVPFPDIALRYLENFLMHASVGLAHALFQLSGTPVLRNGQVVELPGMTLEVARNCSGIRSSLVLFITSLIASYMFLTSAWHRSLLMALVIPLGIIRNAIRVLVIGLLCVHIGPHMIESWIHHQGGPVFFGASVAPLLLTAAWFRQRETRAARAQIGSSTAPDKSLDEQ